MHGNLGNKFEILHVHTCTITLDQDKNLKKKPTKTHKQNKKNGGWKLAH